MEIQMQATPRVNRWLPPSLLCLLGSAALWIDIPVARLARQDRFPGQLKELLENLEPFGHGGAVAVIAIVVYRLESRCRLRNSTGVLLAAFGAGLTANLLKLAVHRVRPWYIAPDVAHGLETFGEMFVSINGENGNQSFPSAHAATAMGLAIALAGYYPRGRLVFYALAGATAASRIIAPSHFVSDTLAGLALGIVIGQLVLRNRRFSPRTTAGQPEDDAEPQRSGEGDNQSKGVAGPHITPVSESQGPQRRSRSSRTSSALR